MPISRMTIDSKPITRKQDRLGAGLIAVVLAASPSAYGQNPPKLQPVSSAGSNAAASRELPMQTWVTGPVLAEIGDPSTGCRWIVVGNAAHPEGPGRVLLVGGSVAVRDAVSTRSARPAKVSVQNELLQPAIQTGNVVVVEEHTSVVDASLAAIALSRAAPGEEFRARLKIGDKVVRARAIDSVRATLVTKREAQP